MSAIRHQPLGPSGPGDSDVDFSDNESSPLAQDIYSGRYYKLNFTFKKIRNDSIVNCPTQHPNGARNQRMGCFPRSTVKGGQRFDGQPGMSERFRSHSQGIRVPDNICDSFGRRCHRKGLCTLYDITNSARPKNSVLQQRFGKF